MLSVVNTFCHGWAIYHPKINRAMWANYTRVRTRVKLPQGKIVTYYLQEFYERGICEKTEVLLVLIAHSARRSVKSGKMGVKKVSRNSRKVQKSRVEMLKFA